MDYSSNIGPSVFPILKPITVKGVESNFIKSINWSAKILVFCFFYLTWSLISTLWSKNSFFCRMVFSSTPCKLGGIYNAAPSHPSSVTIMSSFAIAVFSRNFWHCYVSNFSWNQLSKLCGGFSFMCTQGTNLSKSKKFHYYCIKYVCINYIPCLHSNKHNEGKIHSSTWIFYW